jgi:hypothetical protein
MRIFHFLHLVGPGVNGGAKMIVGLLAPCRFTRPKESEKENQVALHEWRKYDGGK